jgi:hypothetical protein
MKKSKEERIRARLEQNKSAVFAEPYLNGACDPNHVSDVGYWYWTFDTKTGILYQYPDFSEVTDIAVQLLT